MDHRVESQKEVQNRVTNAQLYLLVCLHLASHYPEGVVRGVVVDLDPAEGLRSGAGRHPLLAAIVIDHHSGPSLANTRLTARQGGGAEVRRRKRSRKDDDRGRIPPF